jgi:hypothetical protein
MDYSRKQLPPARHPVRQPRQSALQQITGGLLRVCVGGVIGFLLGEVALRLMGSRTPQSVFVMSHAASLWSAVVSLLPWGYCFAVLIDLFEYSVLGIPLVIGIVWLKVSDIGDNGWAAFFGIVSGVGVLFYAFSDEQAGVTQLLGGPFVLLVIAFLFEVLWLNPMLVADDPKLQGKMKPNFWVYVFLLEGLLVFQKIASHDSIFNDRWDLEGWWLLGEWIFWLAVATLACFEAWTYSKLADDLWHAFKKTELYDAIRRFLKWVLAPWIALPVKYPPYKPPDLFGGVGRLSADQIMDTGLVNDDDPENAPSVEYEKRKTTIIDEREERKTTVIDEHEKLRLK